MDSARVTTDLFMGPARDNKLITVMKRSGNRLYCLDYGLGLHIIDISNFSSPVKKGFYQIPACIDFELNGDTIFANNYRDFIQVDLRDLNNPNFIKREKNFFDLQVKTPDSREIFSGLQNIPPNTVIVSYEKI